MSHINTKCLQAGYVPGDGEPRVMPIVQSTTYNYKSSEKLAQLFDLDAEGFFYTRLANPTVDFVEKKIAALEGGVGAMPVSYTHLDVYKRQTRRSFRARARPRRAASPSWSC